MLLHLPSSDVFISTDAIAKVYILEPEDDHHHDDGDDAKQHGEQDMDFAVSIIWKVAPWTEVPTAQEERMVQMPDGSVVKGLVATATATEQTEERFDGADAAVIIAWCELEWAQSLSQLLHQARGRGKDYMQRFRDLVGESAEEDTRRRKTKT